MLSTNFANFLGDSINSSISTAGVCGITSIADPKAAALGSLASSVAGYAFSRIVGTDYSGAVGLLAAFGFIAVKIGVGGAAGQYYDKNFSYPNMCQSYFLTIIVGAIAARALGVENLNLKF